MQYYGHLLSPIHFLSSVIKQTKWVGQNNLDTQDNRAQAYSFTYYSICIKIANKTQMTDNMIKITCFNQISLLKPDHQPKPVRGEYVLNIVLYSVNKSLKFLDACIRQINQNNEVHIVKCNNITKLAYSLDSCKVGIKTICITDEQIDSETIQKIKQNQDLMRNKDNFVVWLFTTVVDKVNPFWFHTPQIPMITCDQQKMIQMLKSQYEKLRVKLSSFNSTTTIQSADKLNMDIKLEIIESPSKKVLDEEHFYSKRDNTIFDNGVPGVGKYDLNYTGVQKRSPGATMLSAKK